MRLKTLLFCLALACLAGCGSGDSQPANPVDHGVSAVKAPVLPKMPDLPSSKGFDPVCGMAIDRVNAKGSSDFSGISYAFCCTHCKEAFDKNPLLYAYCPVSREKINPDISRECNGRRFYFCSQPCAEQFKP